MAEYVRLINSTTSGTLTEDADFTMGLTHIANQWVVSWL